jgi:hypothetical protein
MNLALLIAIIVLLNLPFGYWRSHTQKFSLLWFLAVHLPVPLIIVLRLLSGIGWHMATYPLFVGSFIVGQFIGGKLKYPHSLNVSFSYFFLRLYMTRRQSDWPS